jgi:GntR family transcriptional regulator, rspAB operon transcriptional repressor
MLQNRETLVEPYFPLDRTDLTDRTYAVLKDRILTRRMEPGARVSVPEIAAALGVSRTPVTDALKRLATEGLVEIIPRRGTFVTGLNASDVCELFDIRMLIESHAVEAIIDSGRAAEYLKAVGEPMARMRRAMVDDDYGDYETFVSGDREMHMTLVEMTHNQRLLEIYTDLNVHIQVTRAHYLDSVENARQAHQEHEAILDGFRAESAEQVNAALRSHVSNVKNRMLDLLAQHGGSL